MNPFLDDKHGLMKEDEKPESHDMKILFKIIIPYIVSYRDPRLGLMFFQHDAPFRDLVLGVSFGSQSV